MQKEAINFQNRYHKTKTDVDLPYIECTTYKASPLNNFAIFILLMHPVIWIKQQETLLLWPTVPEWSLSLLSSSSSSSSSPIQFIIKIRRKERLHVCRCKFGGGRGFLHMRVRRVQGCERERTNCICVSPFSLCMVGPHDNTNNLFFCFRDKWLICRG